MEGTSFTGPFSRVGVGVGGSRGTALTGWAGFGVGQLGQLESSSNRDTEDFTATTDRDICHRGTK